MIDSLQPRKTQITALKLVAVAAAMCTFAVGCSGRDVLLFCDVQAACAAMSKGASRVVHLQLFTTALQPAATISFTTAWAASVLISLTTTAQPSAAKTRACAAPSPPPAPVMIATLPSSIPLILCSSCFTAAPG